MMDKQCEYTEGCIRLKQLVEQVEPQLLGDDLFKVIDLMYIKTAHMPIKEQWKQLDKKTKHKYSQQRINLEAKHKASIRVAVEALLQHEFAGYQNLR